MVKMNHERIIQQNEITDDSLSMYFDQCFDDTVRLYDLYKIWVCVDCIKLEQPTAGFGDKPVQCPNGHTKIYEVSTFQGRASRVGRAFQHACYHLLFASFQIQSIANLDRNRLYDFEIKPSVVFDAIGSPSYLINYHGDTHSTLHRSGMKRTDTEKKAFRNADTWMERNPDGKFYILTNRLPASLIAGGSRVTSIVDVTKADQLKKFVSQVNLA